MGSGYKSLVCTSFTTHSVYIYTVIIFKEVSSCGIPQYQRKQITVRNTAQFLKGGVIKCGGGFGVLHYRTRNPAVDCSDWSAYPSLDLF